MTAAQSIKQQVQPVAAGLVLLLLLCTVVGAASWYVDELPTALARTVALSFFLLIVPFEVLAHEFGHFAVAKLLGWRVPLFSWGPLTLRCSPLRLTVGAPAFGSDAAGAVVAVSPPGRDSSWAWAAVFAGGPATNFVLAAVAFYAAHRAAADSTPHALYLVLAAVSACSGLLNLLPRAGSDGSQIRNVLRYHNGALRGLQARLLEKTIAGVRPRDLPKVLMSQVLRQSLWSDDPDVQLTVYAWHIDRGDVAAARAALARAGADERVLAERAFLSAAIDGDAAAARALLSGTRSWAVHGQTCYWRADAAACVAEGDSSGARNAIRKGRILCREWPYATAFDAECFDILESNVGTAR
jgi:Zn-dependent protease